MSISVFTQTGIYLFFYWMSWVGVGSEMLCVSGQVVLVLVLVLVLGIWGKVRRDWGIGGLGGECK